METLYFVLIIIFAVIFVGAGIVFFILSMDEKNVKEVTTAKLSGMGKEYTKEEFEDTMFKDYTDIEYAKVNNNYDLLKDIVSDEEYNRILSEVKEDREKDIKKVITDIKKGFVKLIDFKIVNDQELAKLWIQYSSIEYTTGKREVAMENGTKEMKEVILSGSDKTTVFHEYIVTFVRNRTNFEKIVCPGCGNNINIILRTKCPICDNLITGKAGHWVYIGKVPTNINKK